MIRCLLFDKQRLGHSVTLLSNHLTMYLPIAQKDEVCFDSQVLYMSGLFFKTFSLAFQSTFSKAAPDQPSCVVLPCLCFASLKSNIIPTLTATCLCCRTLLLTLRKHLASFGVRYISSQIARLTTSLAKLSNLQFNISRSSDDNLGACTRAGIGMSISASCEHYVAPDCIFIRRYPVLSTAPRLSQAKRPWGSAPMW